MPDLAPYLPGMLAAYLILLAGSLSPGPAVALLAATATREGRTPALVATLGIGFGSATLNLATLLGVGLLVSQTAWAMTALRVVGTAYLLYLAWGAFRNAAAPVTLDRVAAPPQTLPRHFVTGYLLQITNPKAVAFWLAIAAIGAVDGAPLAVIVAFVTIGFFSLVSRSRRVGDRPVGRRRAIRLCACTPLDRGRARWLLRVLGVPAGILGAVANVCR